MILQTLSSPQDEEVASDTSSAPYIFLDNSCSTDELDSNTKRSGTPHMFLSYANNDRRSNDVGNDEKPLMPTRKSNQQSTSRCNLHKRSSSAYLFLPYASNHSGASDPCCSSSSEQEVASEIVIRYFGWGKSGQQFEEKCQQHLVKEHCVPHFHASFVAKAVQKAAEEASKAHQNREVSNSYCLYASTFDRLLTVSNNKNKNTGKENSRCPTAPTEAESSLSSQVQSLKVESQRQQEELEFLRCTLRRLILPSTTTARNEEESPKNDYAIDRMDAKYFDVEDDWVHTGIPQEINFIRDDNIDDDISEPTIKIKSEEEMDEGKENLSKCSDNVIDEEKATPQLEPPSYKKPNILQLVGANARKEVSDNEAKPEPVDPNKERNNDTAEYNDHCSKGPKSSVCYDEMAKGDVRGKRARGLRYELCFKKWDNIRFMGMYSGQVRDQQQQQLPHGQGVLRFDNRDLYIGQFCDGEMHGEGTLLCRSNNKQQRIVTLRGCFHHNEYVGRQEQQQKQLQQEQQQTISSSWCEI